MNDTKLKHQLTEAAKTAQYLSRSGHGIRGFADYHIEAFVTTVLPMVELRGGAPQDQRIVP